MDTVVQAGLCVLAGFGLISLFVSLLDRFSATRQHDKRPRISLVVIFRDKENIAEGLLRAILNLRAVGECIDYDVVAVDDRSTDHTSAILDRLARRYSCLRIVKTRDLSQPATAVEAGLALALGDVSVVCDARDELSVAQSVDAIFWLLGPSARRARRLDAGDND